MKRKCKNVDILDIDFIKNAIEKCLKNKNKNRKDIQRLFKQYKTIDELALTIQQEMIHRKLQFPKIWYKQRYDNNSRKWRNIGMQDIKNQIYDYIAVLGLEELEKRLGKYQCASVKNRGQIYCAKAIKNHIKHNKYAIKMDIRKYYESIQHDKMVDWLNKKIKNDNLLWLVETLISEFEQGLSIGSYLSQHLGNLYLSDLYHKVESLHKIRRNKSQKIVSFQAYYMDDLLIVGNNSRELIKVANFMANELKEMGLGLKSNWSVINLDKGFIDMVGFRIYKTHITVRRITLKRIRRTCLRFDKNPKSLARSKRLVSYYGTLKHSNSLKFCHKYDVYRKFRKAKKVISNANNNSLRLQNATS